MYLELRRRLWYALHDIPVDVCKAVGRVRFVQSLETEDKAVAKRRAAILEVRWRGEIEQARKGSADPIDKEAKFWRTVLRDTPEDERPLVLDMIAHEATEMVERTGAKAGIHDTEDPRYEDLPEHSKAQRFFDIATGKLVKLDEHLDEFIATLNNEAKTVDMKRSTIKKFAEVFPHINDVKRKEVQRWVNNLAQEGKSAKTLRRILSEVRGYWSYLVALEVASENNLPFEKLNMPRESAKAAVVDERRPFTPAAVVSLLKAAEAKEDTNLADLIRLGMWTGCRIEELCSLKIAQVQEGFLSIEDAKTPAGWREVPVHPKLKPRLDQLIGKSKDGYVLSGLTENKYGDRSNAIGKRFGRLKAAERFGESYVFHSIRKTVATLFQNAGVSEDIAAGILGHDIPTMTYGLYSGGAFLSQKQAAMEKIDYAGV